MKVLILILFAVLLTGCAENVSLIQAVKYEPVGFWFGVWHGIILPVAWLVSLFSEDTAIYAVYNNGAWYDSGFILGIGISIGLRTAASEIYKKKIKSQG